MASHQNSVAQGKTCDHNNLKMFLIHISRGVLLPLGLFVFFLFYFVYFIFSTRLPYLQWGRYFEPMYE